MAEHEYQRMIGLTLIVVLATYIVFRLIRHLFRKIIDRKIIANQEKWFHGGIQFRNVKILSAPKLVSMSLFASKILRFAVYALLLYAALPLIFAIFPATRHLAIMLFSWIITPLISMGQSFVAYLPNLLRIVVIVVVTRYILKCLRYTAREIEAGRLVVPGFYSDWAHATFNLLRIFIIAFTVVLIFPLLPESESSVFRGVSVFIGVIFSIGSSSVISNMVAGMVITYMRSFKVGDRIKVGDVFGDVVEKALFVIRVQTVKMEIVTVPNSIVLSSNIVNYSAAAREHGQGVILHVDVDIGYEVVWEKANDLLVEAALMTEHIQSEPRPFVLTRSLDSSSVKYQINVYTKRPDLQAKICSDLYRHALTVFTREGVDMIVPVHGVITS